MWELKPTAVENLGRVVNGMTSDPFMREDLMQEALSHWWNMECERPGQTLSWYLQSCSFHLRHFLARGRSVDSSKRRSLPPESISSHRSQVPAQDGRTGHPVRPCSSVGGPGWPRATAGKWLGQGQIDGLAGSIKQRQQPPSARRQGEPERPRCTGSPFRQDRFSMNRPFVVPALAGRCRLKAGLRTAPMQGQ